MLFFVIILSFLGVVYSTNCHEVCDRDHNILDRGGDTLDCYFAGLVADGLYSCYLDWNSTKVDGDECHDEYTDFCCGASLADSTNNCLSNEGYVSYYECYIECESDCVFSASTCDSFSGDGTENGYEYDSEEFESGNSSSDISTMSKVVIGICVFYVMLIICLCYKRKCLIKSTNSTPATEIEGRADI